MYSGARANLESATDWVKRLGLQPLRETRKRGARSRCRNRDSNSPEAKLVSDLREKGIDRGQALRLVEQWHVAARRYRE